MRRSDFLTAGATVALFGLAIRGGAAEQQYEVTHTEAQWRAMLGDDRFEILRRAGTEPAFSSPLIGEKRPGTYACAGCQLVIFSSKKKYDSGDGWPSFWDALSNTTLGVLMATIDSSILLGHIFDDGPPPTHLRYCIDGLALRFVPA